MEEGGLGAVTVGRRLSEGLWRAAAGRGAGTWEGDRVGDGGHGGRGDAWVTEVGIVELSGLGDGRPHLGEHIVGQNEGHHGRRHHRRHHLGRGETCWVVEGLCKRWVDWVEWKHTRGKGDRGNAGLGAHRGPGRGVSWRSEWSAQVHRDRVDSRVLTIHAQA